jgi:hypothetical protein
MQSIVSEKHSDRRTVKLKDNCIYGNLKNIVDYENDQFFQIATIEKIETFEEMGNIFQYFIEKKEVILLFCEIVNDDKLDLYIPDFYLPEEDKYVEIKGYVSENAIEKIKYFPFEIEMIEKEKMKPIFKYIINKYGKNFFEKLKDNEN